MYETYYGKLQPYFGQEKLHLHYVDRDGMILSMRTENIIRDLKNLENLFNFSNLDEYQELFSNINKKVFGKFKIETPKNIWIDEFVALRSEMYAFNCGDESKNKTKGIRKSYAKNIKFQEYKICLDGEKYEDECGKYISRSINHEMNLQQVKKSIFSIFDDKRCYVNETESIPWNSYY